MKLSLILVSLMTLVLLSGCGKQEEKAQANSERHIRSAANYLEQGQMRAAMLEAQNAIKLQPNDFTGYQALAQIYNTMGTFSSSQHLLEPLVSTHPELGTLLAQAYVGSHKYRSALQTLDQYPATNPTEQKTHLELRAQANIFLGDNKAYEQTLAQLAKTDDQELAVALLQTRWQLANGQGDKAEKKLAQFIKKYPDNFTALMLGGEVALYQNKLTIAEDHFTRALTSLPKTDIMTANRAQALNQLTDTLIQLGRSTEAYVYQKILAENNPDNTSAQQRYSDALELFQMGKYSAAEATLLQLHQEFPHNQTTGTLLALVQHKLGQDTAAANLFDEYIDPETTATSVIQAAALTKYRANQTDAALQLLKEASESQPRNAALLASYGNALLEQDITSHKAALALEKSIALDPSQQRLRIALAKHYFALKDDTQAVAQLQKAYAEQPQDFVIQQTYFKNLFEHKQLSQAKSDIDAFAQSFPQDPRRHFLSGWLQMENKNYDQAAIMFQQGIDDPNNTEKYLSYIGLAQVYDVRKNVPAAAAAWQAALKDNPGIMVAYARWLKLKEELNDLDGALSFLKEQEKQENFWQPSVVLARINMLQGHSATAIAHIETALARSADTPQVRQMAAELFYQQGLTLQQQKQLSDAKASLARALKLYPNNLNYLAALVQLEARANHPKEAQSLLDQFSETTDNQAARAYLQGFIYQQAKKTDAANAAFQQSWQLQPNDSAAEAIFTQLAKQEQPTFIDEWLTKLPSSPRPTLFKAMNAQAQGDMSSASKWYEKTLALAPDSIAALNNLAWIYYEQKDPKALVLAQNAYQLAPQSAAVMDTYGWLLVELGSADAGDIAAGYQLLIEASALAPNDQEIAEHLAAAKARLTL